MKYWAIQRRGRYCATFDCIIYQYRYSVARSCQDPCTTCSTCIPVCAGRCVRVAYACAYFGHYARRSVAGGVPCLDRKRACREAFKAVPLVLSRAASYGMVRPLFLAMLVDGISCTNFLPRFTLMRVWIQFVPCADASVGAFEL